VQGFGLQVPTVHDFFFKKTINNFLYLFFKNIFFIYIQIKTFFYFLDYLSRLFEIAIAF